MPSRSVPQSAASATLRDLASLAKPRITLMVVITAAGGMFLAPATIPVATALVMLLTTATVVAGANSLNCWLERDSDRFMERTMNRPLPAGRMEPKIAMVFGASLGLLSVPALTLLVNPVTGALGALALVSYVAVYTPLKQHSSIALLIGAVPGALPPLMGWTAATGSIDAPGLVLFGILFFWQVPHFLAISIYRQEDYERAGLKTLPAERGLGASKRQAFLHTGALVVCTILLALYGTAGVIYLTAAIVLGVHFLWVAAKGFALEDRPEVDRWAKKLFVTSLIYLTVLFAALMIDAIVL
jgi:protoheme IX farnesyltransferase